MSTSRCNVIKTIENAKYNYLKNYLIGYYNYEKEMKNDGINTQIYLPFHSNTMRTKIFNLVGQGSVKCEEELDKLYDTNNEELNEYLKVFYDDYRCEMIYKMSDTKRMRKFVSKFKHNKSRNRVKWKLNYFDSPNKYPNSYTTETFNNFYTKTLNETDDRKLALMYIDWFIRAVLACNDSDKRKEKHIIEWLYDEYLSMCNFVVMNIE